MLNASTYSPRQVPVWLIIFVGIMLIKNEINRKNWLISFFVMTSSSKAE